MVLLHREIRGTYQTLNSGLAKGTFNGFSCCWNFIISVPYCTMTSEMATDNPKIFQGYLRVIGLPLFSDDRDYLKPPFLIDPLLGCLFDCSYYMRHKGAILCVDAHWWICIIVMS